VNPIKNPLATLHLINQKFLTLAGFQAMSNTKHFKQRVVGEVPTQSFALEHHVCTAIITFVVYI